MVDKIASILGIEPNEKFMYDDRFNEDEILQTYTSVWKGMKHTEYSRNLISIKATGRKRPVSWSKNHSNKMKGKKHSEDVKLKISKKLSGKNNPMYGKILTDEDKLKRRLATGTKVIINNISYNSIREAANIIGVSRPTIDNWLKNGKAFYGG